VVRAARVLAHVGHGGGIWDERADARAAQGVLRAGRQPGVAPNPLFRPECGSPAHQLGRAGAHPLPTWAMSGSGGVEGAAQPGDAETARPSWMQFCITRVVQKELVHLDKKI
jgi:hypothetical protein